MHVQTPFRETNVVRLIELVRSHPLATFVVEVGGELTANHFPMLVDDDGAALTAHIPKSNEIWRGLGRNTRALCIFTGPDAYISPSWYPAKKVHGKVVPTWNYSAVHMTGAVQVHHDVAWKKNHLEALTDLMESNRAAPWHVDDAPSSFTAAMMEAIVGLEIHIETMTGKFKLSQNRAQEDRDGAVAGLQAQGKMELAEMMINE